MATQHKGEHESGQQGSVKDPEHDGRLKENRDAGRTKGTTPASEGRAHEAGGKSSSGGHASHQSGGQASSCGSESRHGSSHASHEGGHSGASTAGRGEHGGGQSGSDDLKSREYRDEKGEVHHHTRTYMEQHGGGEKK
jgi:hypothetical protein